MQLIDIRAANEAQRREAANILVDALAHCPSAWSNLEEAGEEVAKFLTQDDWRALLACEDATVLGWGGMIAHSPHAWELHPLVVDPPSQRRGVGSELIAALERIAADNGACTVWLGSDDDFGGTTLFGRDLFPNPLEALADIAPTTGHPFTFYQRMGYVLCGVIPDANGYGRPDIVLAKRIKPTRRSHLARAAPSRAFPAD